MVSPVFNFSSQTHARHLGSPRATAAMAPLLRRRQLFPEERGLIIGMRKCGTPFAAISAELNVNCDTARKIWNYYDETGLVLPPKRTGATTILDDRDRRQLKRYVKASRANRRQPLADITNQFNFNVCDKTLTNELQKLNLNKRVARKKPWLRPEQKMARLEFEKQCHNWGDDEWMRCIYTDEMAMQTASYDGKTYVWREPHEEYYEDCIEPTFIPGFKRVKVWGAIRYGKKSKLVIISENLGIGNSLDAEVYLTEIMDKELYDFWQEAMEDCGHVRVMEDGAPCHQGVASVRRKQLEEVGWEGWGPGTWPSSSPDLNPIENVWHMVKCGVRKRHPPPRTAKELGKAIVEEWEKIPIDHINKLILDMPRRLAAVKEAHGGAISG